MNQEKGKSLYDNLKQKEGEGSKPGEFNASKGWFDNFRKRFSFLNVKITGEADSANQEAVNDFPDTVKKIIEDFNRLCAMLYHSVVSDSLQPRGL